LNGIWEGTGNVICLDVIRSLSREPESAVSFVKELRLSQGQHSAYDEAIVKVVNMLRDLPAAEGIARHVVEHMALTFQAGLLLRYAPGAVAQAFCDTRLGGRWGGHFGTMLDTSSAQQIVDRARMAT